MLTVDRKIFAITIDQVRRLVTPNSPIAVLNAVRLVSRGGRVHLRMCNVDVDAQASIPATGDGDLSVLVNVPKLVGVLRAFPDGEIGIGTYQKDAEHAPMLELSQGKSRLRVDMLDAEIEHPKPPGGEHIGSVELERAQLAKMLAACLPYAGSPNDRFSLSCVALTTIDGVAEACATDGYRLSLTTGPATCPENLTGRRLLVPHVLAAEIAREKSGEPIVLRVEGLDGQPEVIGCTFASGVTATAKSPEGNFPDYGRVVGRFLPETTPVSAVLHTKSLLNAAELAKRGADGVMGLMLDINGVVSLSSRNKSFEAEVESEERAGKGGGAFSIKFLCELAAGMKAPKMLVRLDVEKEAEGARGAGMFAPADDPMSHRVVLMGMNS